MIQFKDLRKGFPVYLFDRNGDLNITMGRASSDASSPHIDYNATAASTQRPMQMIVEVGIEIDGKTQSYVIPEDAIVTITPDNKVLSTDIAPIMREVENMSQRSQEILDSVAYNQKRKQRCEELLEQWNPELRSKRENERRFTSIESQVSDLRKDVSGKFDKIMEKLGITNT